MTRTPYEARRTLGENVRRLRVQKNLTQQQLAKKIQVRSPWISDVETAKTNATIDNIERLARALGATVADLLRKQ